MKRLYKIIILFAVIFLIGMYFSVKSINEAFIDDTETEVISTEPLTDNKPYVTIY
jgi:hypothetical protein